MSLAPWTDAPHASSSKYKAYVQSVEKALKAFENSNEWADLISALGKLAKVRPVALFSYYFSFLED